MTAGLQVFNTKGQTVFDSNMFKVLKPNGEITYDSYTYRNVGTYFYFTLKYTIPPYPEGRTGGFVFFAGRPILIPMFSYSFTNTVMITGVGANLNDALAKTDLKGKVFVA